LWTVLCLAACGEDKGRGEPEVVAETMEDPGPDLRALADGSIGRLTDIGGEAAAELSPAEDVADSGAVVQDASDAGASADSMDAANSPDADVASDICTDECCSDADCQDNDPCTCDSCIAGTCYYDEDCILADFDFDFPCSMEGWSDGFALDDCANHTPDGLCALHAGNTADCNVQIPMFIPGPVSSPPINVDDFQLVEVSFWYYPDVGDSLPWSNFFRLEMDQYWPDVGSIGSPIELWSKSADTGLGPEWFFHSQIVDLSQYDWVPGLAPKEVKFTFKYNSDVVGSPPVLGFFVDDFRVTSTCL